MCTRSPAGVLRRAVAVYAAVVPGGVAWDLVVDDASTGHTRDVVGERSGRVPLGYLVGGCP